MWKHKLLDIVLVFLALFLGVFFFKLVKGNLGLQEKVEVQELQASALIDEVGQTKEENQALYEKFLEVEERMKNLQKVEPPRESRESEIEKIPRPKVLPPLPSTKNFLLIGHQKRLADSIMLAAVNESANKITLISIPRDLVVNGRKINEYLSLYGAAELKEKVETVSGLPIHSYAIFNFHAFETIIDILGGIDTYVPTAIYDPLYPDGNGGYTLYSISAGANHMSGAEALQYARSRHSTSDFDRAKRQQQILKAIQERILNFDILNRLDEMKGIFEALVTAIEIDLPFLIAMDVIVKYQGYTIESGHVISTENFLSSGMNIGGQYILVPRGGNFLKIQKWVREIL